MVTGARAGSADDAILGVAPRIVVEPSTVAEAAEALRACAGDRLSVAFVGGGTDLEVGAPPRALDAVVRTRKLARLVEHAPSDQIATVEAGMRLAELQGLLAAHGQRLALDPPLPEVATIGGAVAANAFGPLRHRYGGARDLVVGMTVVRADGVVAKGGGKVVKNVAGFDLPRLLVGSFGTLALVATVTVRLHPLPEARSTVLFPRLDAQGLRDLVVALRASQLEPSALAALLEGDGLRLGARFEGFGPGVAEATARALALGERLGRPAERLDDGAAVAFWSRHDVLRTEGSVRLRLSAPPSSLPDVVAGLRALLGTVAGGAAVLYPGLGAAFASGAAGDAEPTARALADLRAALGRLGGAAVLLAAPTSLRALADPWGPPPSSLALHRRVKDALDPDRRLAPGRFIGGL